MAVVLLRVTSLNSNVVGPCVLPRDPRPMHGVQPLQTGNLQLSTFNLELFG